ncbi:MAG TPA: cytochrome c-type biogenesis protein [Gammaproteobacteria bacterium]|nr:cytochrome c-type biogenesis protein [Gammaproteobacteria bacterium]
MRRWWFALMLLMMPALQVWAAGPPATEGMTPAMADRFKALTAELRCLVCQDEDILVSPSDFAADIRREVRDMMMNKHMTDKQIKAFLVHRYGDFILYRPPFQSNTVFLWIGPFILMVLGAAALLIYIRRRDKGRPTTDAALTPGQERRVKALLKDGGGERNA